MNTDRKIEILNKTILVLTKTNHFKKGICDAVTYLCENDTLNYLELIEFREFIRDNKPTAENEYKEFTQGEYWVDEMYWWYPIYRVSDTREIRVEYLTKLINNIK